MNGIHLNDLIIEVTRQCNLNCEHCLRGDSQTETLNTARFREWLIANNIQSIGTIQFTGGEPSLNVKAIREIRKLILYLEIDVYSFFCYTNGYKTPPDFAHEMLKWYEMCDDMEDESGGVQMSRDDWHEAAREENDDPYPTSAPRSLKGLSFFSVERAPRRRSSFDLSRVIPMGRGLDIGGHGRQIKPSENEIDQEDNRVESLLFFNVFGRIFNVCDLSYEEQDEYPEEWQVSQWDGDDLLLDLECYNGRFNEED